MKKMQKIKITSGVILESLLLKKKKKMWGRTSHTKFPWTMWVAPSHYSNTFCIIKKRGEITPTTKSWFIKHLRWPWPAHIRVTLQQEWPSAVIWGKENSDTYCNYQLCCFIARNPSHFLISVSVHIHPEFIFGSPRSRLLRNWMCQPSRIL